MTYEKAMDFIHNSEKLGSVLGLDNMYNLMAQLGNIQNELKIIHIAGTNGKGSVGAFTSGILKNAGFKVGRYVSPTITEYLERFQINDTIIEKEKFCSLCEKVQNAIEKMIVDGKSHPTAFEIETAIAFLYFYEEKCDFVLLETGLGGRLDATNIIEKNICSVITSISYDHTQFLGDTLSDIAYEKCGIIKENCPVVSIEQDDEAMSVIEKVSKEKKSDLTIVKKSDIAYTEFENDYQIFDYQDLKDIKIKLLGKFQTENASIAISIAKLLISKGFSISTENIYNGLFETVWQGRFQVIMKKPLFIVDGAHNEDAAKRLRETIKLYFQNRKITYIVGIFKDKNYKRIIELTADLADKIYTIQLDNPRRLDIDTLTNEFLVYNQNTEKTNNVEDAIDKSLSNSKDEDVIIAFGSLSYLGDVIKIIRKKGELQ